MRFVIHSGQYVMVVETFSAVLLFCEPEKMEFH